jgi:hypothetical protein
MQCLCSNHREKLHSRTQPHVRPVSLCNFQVRHHNPFPVKDILCLEHAKLLVEILRCVCNSEELLVAIPEGIRGAIYTHEVQVDFQSTWFFV